MRRTGPDEFQDEFARLRAALDPALASRISEVLAGLPVIDGEALKAALVRGKKIRGVLLCSVAEALGGSLEDALPRAVAVEIVQAASLIHDDVVDGDAVRRGAPAVWASQGVRRAILIGDLLFSGAIASMSELSREDGLVISRAIAEISRGACLEPLELPGGEAAPPLANASVPYETIIRLKTGILFEAACRLAALAADQRPPASNGWARYGLLLGEAYQIADDLQDLRVWLAAGAVDARKAAPLLPALMDVSQDPSLRWEDAPRILPSAIRALETRLETRLAQAREAILPWAPAGASGELLRRLPGEFIRLFNREEKSARAA